MRCLSFNDVKKSHIKFCFSEAYVLEIPTLSIIFSGAKTFNLANVYVSAL